MQKRLIQKLAEECTENVEEVKLAKITLAVYENKCKSSCTLYIKLFSTVLQSILELVPLFFTTNIQILVKSC